MRLIFTTDMPPSTNNVYKNIIMGKRVLRGLTSAGVKFKRKVKKQAAQVARDTGWTYTKGQRLALRLALTFKDGRRSDISNRIKLIEDAIAEVLGFDDMVIDYLSVERTPQGDPCCQVVLEHIEE